jgi:uncharacterized membrane protein YccC
MFGQFIEWKASDRKWDFAALAGLCVGVPLLGGYFLGNMPGGKLASLAGLVILYIHSMALATRMITLMACSFGFLISVAVGALFSVDPLVAALALGGYAALVHLSLHALGLTRPPGNFFFILVASVSICLPYSPRDIPERIGYVAIGTLLSCLLGLLYSLLTFRRAAPPDEVIQVPKTAYVSLIESLTFGLFIGLSLLMAQGLGLANPYWVPTTCAAVMQGSSTRHVWQRSLQRILGTLVGLGLTWLILLLRPTLLDIALGIILLQMVVEWLVVRNYGLAVVFITILTIFLAESGTTLTIDVSALIKARLIDIVLGSVLGAAGGWVLYNERLQRVTTERLRKTRQLISRRK